METRKYKYLYLWINIPMICCVFLVAPSLVVGKVFDIYYIGVISRVILGVWCIFNGIWNGGTNYYSIFKTNRFRKINNSPKWAWWIVFIVGIACLITAFMGYGYNNVGKPM